MGPLQRSDKDAGRVKNQKQAKHRSESWISLAVGLMLARRVNGVGRCSKNGANSSAEKVVKNSIGMEFAAVPAGTIIWLYSLSLNLLLPRPGLTSLRMLLA
jgi:hypothetical protein